MNFSVVLCAHTQRRHELGENCLSQQLLNAPSCLFNLPVLPSHFFIFYFFFYCLLHLLRRSLAFSSSLFSSYFFFFHLLSSTNMSVAVCSSSLFSSYSSYFPPPPIFWPYSSRFFVLLLSNIIHCTITVLFLLSFLSPPVQSVCLFLLSDKQH